MGAQCEQCTSRQVEASPLSYPKEGHLLSVGVGQKFRGSFLEEETLELS